MKRSQINAIMRDTLAFLDTLRFKLPPFAFWTPEHWKGKGRECDEIRDNMLGWDITDFGSGDYAARGALLFTLRNGNYKLEQYTKPYAEKVIIMDEAQTIPMHFHWHKMEDIINRGGSNVLIKVYNSDANEQLADTDVELSLDGVRRIVPAGTEIRLTPGDSITLTQGMYHDFYIEKGRGKVLIGEVSKVNDDNADNRFLESLPRFATIDEDEPPLYYLANEYPPARV